MKLPNWFKIIYWICLSGIVTYFIWQRYNFFINGTATLLDIFIFLIWMTLLLVPLFQEVNLFGIKLKTEIDSLKSEIKEQIINLRADIQNTINVRAQINPQFNFTPPSDSQLPMMKEHFRQILDEELRMRGIERPSAPSEIEVPENAKYLFSVRYKIEKELRRIQKQRFGEENIKRPMPVNQMTRSLVQSELMDTKLANVIREVSAVCSPAIHGEEVSSNQVKFVREIAPELIETLKSI